MKKSALELTLTGTSAAQPEANPKKGNKKVTIVAEPVVLTDPVKEKQPVQEPIKKKN